MSTLNTARDRGDLAEAMLPVAANLACLVHGDGGPEDIQEQLAALDAAQKDALIVVLAGLVDPDGTTSRSLGWLTFDEHGQPVAATAALDDRTTLRQLAEDSEVEAEVVDEVAVMAYMQGRPVTVTPRERVEAIALGVRRGMTYPDFDRAHGLTKGATSSFISRERKRAAKKGEPFPDLVPVTGGTKLTEQQVVAIREAVEAGTGFLSLSLSYGVDRGVISRLVHGETYQEFGGPIRVGRRRSGGFRLKGPLSTGELAKAS